MKHMLLTALLLTMSCNAMSKAENNSKYDHEATVKKIDYDICVFNAEAMLAVDLEGFTDKPIPDGKERGIALKAITDKLEKLHPHLEFLDVMECADEALTRLRNPKPISTNTI
ncbi:hypothetical protein DYB89_14810 [Vibrio cholerae]|nr:hypothetical protein [Vibrio cholerae]